MSKKEEKNQGTAVATRRSFLKRTAAVSAGAAVGVGLVSSIAKAAPGDGVDVECVDVETVYADLDASEIRWGMLIDLNRCAGCRACMVACKTANDVRLGNFRSGVINYESGTYPNTTREFVPWLCNHCSDPICIRGCPADPVAASLTFPDGTEATYWARATYQRPDGLVLRDASRCVGCGRCVTRCPYQARYIDRNLPAGGDGELLDPPLTIPDAKASGKCTMCVHRLENGVVPACVNTCPAEARIAGNLNDSGSTISVALAAAGANASRLKEGGGTEPSVYYIGLNETAYDDGEEPRKEAGLQTEVPSL